MDTWNIFMEKWENCPYIVFGKNTMPRVIVYIQLLGKIKT